MRARAIAWSAGLALLVAAPAVPARPALAAEPLPPCFPGATEGQWLVPDPSGGLTLPALPLVPGVLRLPGVVYCDPALPLPPIPLPGPLPPLPDPIGPIVDGIVDPLLGDSGLPVVGDPVPVPAPIAVLDEEAPVFTQPAAQAGAGSLEIVGLRSVGIVLVRTIDGDEIPVIRIVADSIAIDDFVLDVRPDEDSAAAVNDSARLELTGNVRVYLQSLTATGPGGVGISLLAPTPVPGDELPPSLLRATFGLVGATADSSVWEHTHLRIAD